MIDDSNVVDDVTAAAERLFDRTWYLAQYPDVERAGLEPVAHWFDFGWQEGRQPSPFFDPIWYLAQNPDVAAAGLNPLLHYAEFGDREGRKPNPVFDPSWYRSVYSLPADVMALDHFLRNWRSGHFIPAPALYAAPFMRGTNEASDLDHFATAILEMSAARKPHPLDRKVIEDSNLLDVNFYLINGSDVHETGIDPIDHFCEFGWREGRKPNIYFDTNWYLATNHDIQRLQVNPLTHYILEGEKAGRRPIAYFDPLWYRSAYHLNIDEGALAHYMAHRRSQRFSPNEHFDVAWYISTYASRIGPNRDPFSHFLHAGTVADIDPSPRFSSASYRRRHIGKVSRSFPHLMQPNRHNPLVHFLLINYV